MLRISLFVGLLVGLSCLTNSAECGDRRFRSQRSFGDHQPGYSQPAYGPVQRTNGLPYGRAYYGGRYFGNFNNRFYGPQYGYF